MALIEEDIQKFLGGDDSERSEFRSDSGSVGRASIDGVLVIYDLDDIPAWFAGALRVCDEDGNTGLAEPRTSDESISRYRVAAGF
jgi:hypothetical protein